MRVGFIVEGLDLHVSRGAVQRDSFGERLICLKPNHATSVARGLRLQLGKQTPTDAETARRVCDPHTLELCGLVGVELQRSAADWLRAESCDEQKTGGRPEFVGIGRDADGGIEAGLESLVELAEILTHAELRMWMKGIERLDLDHCGGKESFNVVHRFNEPVPLSFVEWFEKRFGELVTPFVEHSSLGKALGREASRADPLIRLTRLDCDKTGRSDRDLPLTLAVSASRM
jgi:hypothetical protein